MSTEHRDFSNESSKLILKGLCLILFCRSPHTGVRVVQIVRHVRALSVWRESAPSVVQRARSAPALQPQPSPAPHLANTPTGMINVTHSHKSSYKCFARGHLTSLLFTLLQYVRWWTGERLWHGGQLACLGCLWPQQQSLLRTTLHRWQQSELRAPRCVCCPWDRAQQANCSYCCGASIEGAEQQQPFNHQWNTWPHR